MQVATEEPPVVVSFLKPGFTAIPNFFWDHGVIQNLKLSELTLLLILWRYISGYLKTGAIIGEGFLLEKTKFSPATLYSAKRRLCQLGYILISHTQTGRCYYQLAPFLQAVRTDDEVAPANGVVKSSRSEPSRPPEGDPSSPQEDSLYKEKKENLDQHHCPPPSPPPVGNDDESLPISQDTTSRSRRHALTDHLKALGVSEFMARKLSRDHSEEVITQAISRLKQKPVENPAGYLVSEILRGGYGQIQPDKTVVARLEHEKISALRRTERQQHENKLDQKAAQDAALLAQFEKLPPAHRDELLAQLATQAQQEGFTRLRGWNESHPAYLGLLAEIVGRALAQDQRFNLRE